MRARDVLPDGSGESSAEVSSSHAGSPEEEDDGGRLSVEGNTLWDRYLLMWC